MVARTLKTFLLVLAAAATAWPAPGLCAPGRPDCHRHVAPKACRCLLQSACCCCGQGEKVALGCECAGKENPLPAPQSRQEISGSKLQPLGVLSGTVPLPAGLFVAGAADEADSAEVLPATALLSRLCIWRC